MMAMTNGMKLTPSCSARGQGDGEHQDGGGVVGDQFGEQRGHDVDGRQREPGVAAGAAPMSVRRCAAAAPVLSHGMADARRRRRSPTRTCQSMARRAAVGRAARASAIMAAAASEGGLEHGQPAQRRRQRPSPAGCRRPAARARCRGGAESAHLADQEEVAELRCRSTKSAVGLEQQGVARPQHDVADLLAGSAGRCGPPR